MVADRLPTCPAQTREIMDRLEVAVARPLETQGATPVQGDLVEAVPGSPEPPD